MTDVKADAGRVDDQLAEVSDGLLDLYLRKVDIRKLAKRIGIDYAVVRGLIEWASDRDAGRSSARSSRKMRECVYISYNGVPEGVGKGSASGASITPALSVHNPGGLFGSRRCEVCGVEFAGGRVNRKYCGRFQDRCRKLAARRRKGENIEASLRMMTDPPACRSCGELLTGRRAGTRFCDSTCSRHHRRARQVTA